MAPESNESIQSDRVSFGSDIPEEEDRALPCRFCETPQQDSRRGGSWRLGAVIGIGSVL